MIGWFITSRIGRFLAAAGALLLTGATLWFGAHQKNKGRNEAKTEAMIDSSERQEEGREAVQDLRDADRDELTRRLREADSKW